MNVVVCMRLSSEEFVISFNEIHHIIRNFETLCTVWHGNQKNHWRVECWTVRSSQPPYGTEQSGREHIHQQPVSYLANKRKIQLFAWLSCFHFVLFSLVQFRSIHLVFSGSSSLFFHYALLFHLKQNNFYFLMFYCFFLYLSRFARPLDSPPTMEHSKN